MEVQTEKPTALVLHPRHGAGLDEALATIPGVSLLTPATSGEVVALIEAGAGALVTFDWEDDFLSPHLRWVQAISAGVDHFPVDSLADAGVVLTSARGAHTPAVAEHAVALLFSLARGIGPAMRRVVEHEWRLGPGTEVRAMTVCVVGMGSIGTEIAQMLSALGCDVIGVRREPRPSPFARQVYGVEGLIEACRAADAVVCALPHDESTLGLIGDDELAALGRGWLINVGRGSTVDETALLRALVDGDLAGAALDVTATEPLPEGSPLWDLEQVIVTPHMAWASDGLNARLVEVVAANETAYRGRGDWCNRVV